ncbi:hypothetical protein A7U60_g3127 [Sanghuangporus baumii]|uniref:Uncharacterized protein n=1 Tax=Sanghuangporus baumii TaxID=108892 RepID=A0A9Q5I0X2_SANBA|nr:hypothetical protein A7U60_g3127 [Sanghuangporus baumii]
MAYVPPHLRNRRQVASQNETESKSLVSRLSYRQSRITSSNSTHSLDDIADLLGCSKHCLSTLTVVKPLRLEEPNELEDLQKSEDDTLRAILLFDGQHPEWKSEHKVLCKSNLHVLHKLANVQLDQIDQSSTHSFAIDESSIEYPLFQQIPFLKNNFDFAGWWCIQSITFLAPRSAELIALFEKKFSTQDKRGRNTFNSPRGSQKARSEEAWRDSLRRQWAVVALVQNHARKDLPEPAVKNCSNTRDEVPKDSSNAETYHTD